MTEIQLSAIFPSKRVVISNETCNLPCYLRLKQPVLPTDYRNTTKLPTVPHMSPFALMG